MRKLTLQEIQQQGLDIMRDIHAFCVEHNIKYTLAYGSMIGAIRHKGFIPWDDDIDVLMPRKDWERFSKTFVSSKGYRLLPAYDKSNYLIFTRVYDDKKTVLRSPVPTCKKAIGVWVDVLPIDGLPMPVEDFPYEDLCVLLRNTVSLRIAMFSAPPPSLWKRIKKIIKKIIIYPSDIHDSIMQFHGIAKQYEFGKTEMCSNLCCRDALDSHKMEVLYTVDFEKYQLMPFEDTEFFVATGYDRILRMIYGDYMEFPSKEKQVARHASVEYFKKE